MPPLVEAKLAISGRRAVMLAGGIASLSAASRVLGKTLKLEDCALATLRAGLPQRAQGRVIEASKLTAIHRSAVQQAGEAEGAPMRRIRVLSDPVARVAEGLRLYGEGVDKTELSTLVSEAFALLPLPRRYLFARHVLPLAAARDCPERAGVRAPGRADGEGRRDVRAEAALDRRLALRHAALAASSRSGSRASRAATRTTSSSATSSSRSRWSRSRTSTPTRSPRSMASGGRCSAGDADEREAA